MDDEVGDVMYYHQVISQENTQKIIQTHIKAVNGHLYNGDWKLFPCSKYPEGMEPVPSVCAMHRKKI